MVEDCGRYFAELFCTNCLALYGTGYKRDRNVGAPFAFGENHFRKYLANACRNGIYLPPPHWPDLVIERKVLDDSNGCIDYLFVKRGRHYDSMRNVLATCELKGPTRPVLLKGSTKNWYPALLKDMKKQVHRARLWPDCQHYLAILIRPIEGSDVRGDFWRVLDKLLRDVDVKTRLEEVSWRELREAERLNTVVLRVLPAES